MSPTSAVKVIKLENLDRRWCSSTLVRLTCSLPSHVVIHWSTYQPFYFIQSYKDSTYFRSQISLVWCDLIGPRSHHFEVQLWRDVLLITYTQMTNSMHHDKRTTHAFIRKDYVIHPQRLCRYFNLETHYADRDLSKQHPQRHTHGNLLKSPSICIDNLSLSIDTRPSSLRDFHASNPSEPCITHYSSSMLTLRCSPFFRVPRGDGSISRIKLGNKIPYLVWASLLSLKANMGVQCVDFPRVFCSWAPNLWTEGVHMLGLFYQSTIVATIKEHTPTL